MSVHDHRFEIAARPARLMPTVLTAWGLASLVLIVTCAGAIARQSYPDPDDILRLLEVRDLIAGQSWWDVDQHRLASGLMHWSRLVDLPIAAVELLVRPFVGLAIAERVALVVVPLLTLGVVMMLAALITRRLLDDERARSALLIAPLSVPLIYQMRPMRIDHHGWQVALALAALLAFLDPRRGWRSGALGGVALATLLTISLEGLPIAAALLGLVALAWAFDPSRRAQFLGASGATFGVAALLHLATRGPNLWSPACDAMSPVWLAVLATAAGGSALATVLPRVRSDRVGIALRLGALALIGVACAGVLLAVDPRCTAGPFQMLPPLVRQMWYDKVSEGLPIWEQLPIWAAMTVGLPLVGLVGSALAWRAARGERRLAWTFAAGALIAAFALSLLVNRAGATANAFALPGAAFVLTALLARARRVERLLPRTAATAGALLAAAPGLAAVPILGFPEDQIAAAGQARLTRETRLPCERAEDSRVLTALPPALLFVPIDIAPEVIAATDHHAITSGHHRNAAAMADVLLAFTGSPERARAVIARYGADYVVGCPGLNETELYDAIAPDGFWARLERGERFAWLRPVTIPGARILVWRVVDTEQPLS